GERRPARRSIRPTGFGTRKDRENRLLRTTPPRGESHAITGPAILTSESLLIQSSTTPARPFLNAISIWACISFLVGVMGISVLAVAQGDLPAAARHFTAGLKIRERLAPQ